MPKIITILKTMQVILIIYLTFIMIPFGRHLAIRWNPKVSNCIRLMCEKWLGVFVCVGSREVYHDSSICIDISKSLCDECLNDNEFPRNLPTTKWFSLCSPDAHCWISSPVKTAVSYSHKNGSCPPRETFHTLFINCFHYSILF